MLLDLIGGGVVLLVVYRYTELIGATERGERRVRRQALLQAAMLFLGLVYGSTVLFPDASSWTVAVGDNLLTILSTPGEQLTNPTSGPGSLLFGLKTVGLVVYSFLWIATSLTARFPILLYNKLFG